MGLFSNFKSLWNRTPDCASPPAHHIAPLTAPPAGAQSAASWSSPKGKASMIDTLRHHFRRYRTSSKSGREDSTYETAISSSGPLSQLALKFEDSVTEGGSLVDFFQNYQVINNVSVPSTRSRSCSRSRSPAFSVCGSSTSSQTAASTFRSSKLGLRATGLAPFGSTSVFEGHTIATNHQETSTLQNIPSSCADVTRQMAATTLRCAQDGDKHQPATPEHDKIQREGKAPTKASEQDSAEREAPSPKLKETPLSSHTPSENAGATSAGSEGSSKTALERHDWTAIEQIPDESFKRLLQNAINQKVTRNVAMDDCYIEQRFRGGFNHIVFMEVVIDKRRNHYVVRVPSIGSKDRWREGDAHNMRCEVALTKYLHLETGVPVPKIISFKDTFDSVIGAPYILMKRMRGRPAQSIWYDDPANRTYETTSHVTPETEVKRYNFLRSLAYQMAKLETLQFDQIGMPDFTNTLITGEKPKITCSYRWKRPYQTNTDDLESDSQVYKYGPFESSKDYMLAKIDTTWPLTPDPDLEEYPDTQNMLFGIRKILDIVYSHPTITSLTTNPSDTEGPESFVLRHPDLDFQNILCDDDGNVSGIIDWERCLAVPRCAGYTCVPDFLRRDWSGGYEVVKMPHMDWQIDHYVQIYADAMHKAGAKDAVYTRKSAMYRAIVEAVSSGDAMDLIQKLFACIPALRRVDAEQFEQLIGKGCPAAEEFLRAEIEKLLAPEDLS